MIRPRYISPRNVLLILLLLPSTQLLCQLQNPFRYSEMIGSDQGLPSDRVYAVTEDGDGFWWIGTSEGLVRYDGTFFQLYESDKNFEQLIDNRIRDILCVGNDLWVSTHIGLSRLDLTTGVFHNYAWTYQCDPVYTYDEAQEAVYKVHLAQDSTIWIGTHYCGYARYDAELDSFVFFQVDTSQLIGFGSGPFAAANKARTWNTRSFSNDNTNDSVLWVGTVAALIRHNLYTDESDVLVRFLDGEGRGIQTYGYMCLTQRDDGLMYTGVEPSGLATFDPRTGEYGAHYTQHPQASAVLQSSPTGFIRRNDSTMWITTWHGMAVYDLKRDRFTAGYLNNEDERIYRGVDFVDRDGRLVKRSIWGMFIYDPIQQQFESSEFKDLNQGLPGYVYSVTHDTATNRYYACVRSSMGLYYMDLADGSWHRIDLPRHLYSNGYVGLTDMSRLSSGEYLITTVTDLVRYDPRTHRVTGPEVSLPLSVQKLQDVFVDSRDVAWISSREDGVFQYNTNTGKVVNFRFPQRTLSVAAGDSETFAEDSRGRIWMKRRSGYSVYFPEKDSIAHYYPEGFDGLYYEGLQEDDYGNMWIGSHPGWLGRVDLDSVGNGIVDKYEIEGADNSNSIIAFAKGPDGHFWLAMTENLLKVNMQDLTHEAFAYNYGVDPNEFFSFQFMEDGTMVFGKRNEIVLGNPTQLHRNHHMPKPYVTELYLGAEPLYGDTLPLRRKSLHLQPDENNFSIGFSTLGMSFGDENTIWYRLDPLQSEWTLARNTRVANFTNIPSGEYTFELKAANNEGNVNPEIFQLPVFIATPWYNTILARLAFAAIVLLLLILAYKFRVDQIRKEERMKADFERQLGEVQMSALRAQMNPHFIFNCLNSIENFIIKNDTYRASTYLNDFARLIRLMLQNSRSELINLDDEVEALELYLEMENLRFTDRFEYEISIAPEVDTSGIEIPPMLIQPYIENAIWHGLMHKKTPGKLLVELTRQNGNLKCIIEDNGVGRKRSQEINSQKKIKKKSVGMSITQDRITMLNSMYDTNTHINIHDLKDPAGNPAGTRVELIINI